MIIQHQIGLRMPPTLASRSKHVVRVTAARHYSAHPSPAPNTWEPKKTTTTTTTTIPSRWLTDTKARIGKCITFGMPASLVALAGETLQVLGRDWRNLVAGSEGYLTEKERAGLHRQAIVWGEQDSMGHVNNVMYVRFAESGRCNWTRNIGQYFDPRHKSSWEDLLTNRGIGLILKSITVDFKFPMTWPDRVWPDSSSSRLASPKSAILSVAFDRFPSAAGARDQRRRTLPGFRSR